MSVSRPPASRRWIALVFIALAQLMVMLDATVVNIALPWAQKALDISDADRQWMITSYTLAFGGLLLFGGRIGDLIGRKRAFLAGLVGFAGASALGGVAMDEAMLLGARALQGASAALLAPSALSLLAMTFTAPKERAKAFGVYSAIAVGGGAVGLILGGMLTEYMNWRWALYVNVPFAVIAFAGGRAFITDPVATRTRPRLDVLGMVLVTAGLVTLVYGFTRAESESWRDHGVIILFMASALLLIGFFVAENLITAPLLPMRVVRNRNRGGAYLGVGLAVIGLYGLFLFLTYYMQSVKGYSPFKTGLAFMPMTVGMIVGAMQISARLMNRVSARTLMVPGLLVAAMGLLLLTQVRVGSSYVALVLPAQVLLGLGLGMVFPPGSNLATAAVGPRDAGVASAMVSTSQQIGGSLGTALLNTIAASTATTYVAARTRSPGLAAAALVHGFNIAVWWAIGAVLLAAVLVTVLVGSRPAEAAAKPASAKRKPAPDPGRHRGSATRSRAAHVPDGSGASVRGHVRDGAGVPAAGAVLTLIDMRGRQVAQDSTRPDGSYALTAPGAGQYMLVTAVGGRRPEAATVVLGDGPVFHDVTLPDTSHLVGIVRDAATGVPLRRATVVVIDVHGETVASAETGEDGAFFFTGLVAGVFVLAVSAGGHRPASVPVQFAGVGTTRYEVKLEAGVRVHGIVRAGGGVLAGAGVMLVDAAGVVVATATTGPDGEYTFEGLKPGPYTVIASGYPAVATALMVGENSPEGFALTLSHPDE